MTAILDTAQPDNAGAPESRHHRERDQRRHRDRRRRSSGQRENDMRRRSSDDSRTSDSPRRRPRSSPKRRRRSRSSSSENDSPGEENALAKTKRTEPSSPKAADSDEDEELSRWIESKRNKAVAPTAVRLGGGAYIPPGKLREMQAKNLDKNSDEYQRAEWDKMKKKIHGLVNRVNTSNVVQIIQDLFKVNLIRGKGLFTQALLTAQAFAESYSHIMAALAAVINSKFPAIGELLLHRLLDRFKRAFKRNDRTVAVASIKFIAHLINQQVAHEVLALELLTLLLENPTDDSVELAVAFLKECGATLTELTPVGMNAIFDRLRAILHEAEVETRVQFMIEVLFQIRKDKFANNPAVIEELDLVDEADQITHAVSLDTDLQIQERLNYFTHDPDYEKNEQAYDDIRNEILAPDSGEESEESGEEEPTTQEGGETVITDMTESNLTSFRRTVYLTIQSSLDFQEAIHKILKIDIKPGYELELCNMVLDCCAQQRTYEKFFGLMAERFCRLKPEYQKHFEAMLPDVYSAIHRFELTKLRNTACMFAHLLFTDAISWTCLQCIRLTEQDTSSSSRIFIKVLFHELAEFMGLQSLYERVEDATIQVAFEGLFPRDHPHNTRFAINFFTSIGLGGLTIGMREHLKENSKQQVAQYPVVDGQQASESDTSSSSSDDDDSSADSDDKSSDGSKSVSLHDSNGRRRPPSNIKPDLSPRRSGVTRSDARMPDRRRSRSPPPLARTDYRGRPDLAQRNSRMERRRSRSPDYDSRRKSPLSRGNRHDDERRRGRTDTLDKRTVDTGRAQQGYVYTRKDWNKSDDSRMDVRRRDRSRSRERMDNSGRRAKVAESDRRRRRSRSLNIHDDRRARAKKYSSSPDVSRNRRPDRRDHRTPPRRSRSSSSSSSSSVGSSSSSSTDSSVEPKRRRRDSRSPVAKPRRRRRSCSSGSSITVRNVVRTVRMEKERTKRVEAEARR